MSKISFAFNDYQRQIYTIELTLHFDFPFLLLNFRISYTRYNRENA